MFPLVEFPFGVQLREICLIPMRANKWNALQKKEPDRENGWMSYHKKQLEAFDTIEANKYYVNSSMPSDTHNVPVKFKSIHRATKYQIWQVDAQT